MANGIYLAGLRMVCDLRGHRWEEGRSEDGQRELTCLRCRLVRSGRPFTPPEP
jgi:hypothetical protein